jgi:orotate phosphoribosyltransferase
VTARDRLLTLLRERSFVRRKVRLASGRESDYLIDCKETVLGAEGHALVGEVMLEAVRGIAPPVAAVAGVALGGLPLASAVSLTSHLRGADLPALYVRKEAKDHGTGVLVEGLSAVRSGARVALLEDVVTTGGSSIQAADRLRAAGVEVAAIVALVDRQEGAREAFEAAGLPLVSVYLRSDFMGPA